MKFVEKSGYLWKENKVLCILSIVSCVITLLYYISYDWAEWFPGAGKWFELANNIALALIANFIFFIFQTFLPNMKKRERAFIVAKAKIEGLYFLMSDIVLVTEKYVTFGEEDEVKKLEGTKYFIRYELGKECGWLTRVDFTEEGIEKYKKGIERLLENMLENQLSPYLSEEFFDKISLLQSNRYIGFLDYAVQIDKNSNVKRKYTNVKEEFKIFKEVTCYLGNCVNKACNEVKDASEEQIAEFAIYYKKHEKEIPNAILRRWVSLHG